MSVVFSSFANTLSKNFQVYVVDYENGPMHNLCNKKINIVSPKYIDRLCVDLIICQITEPWNLKALAQFPQNPSLFFYAPTGIPMRDNIVLESLQFKKFRALINLFSFRRKQKIKQFLSISKQKNAVGTSEKLTQFIDWNLPIIPLPQAIENTKKTWTRKKRIVSIYWVSRIESFKIQPLLELLKQIINLKGNSVRVTIIGTGDQSFELSSHIKSLNMGALITFKDQFLELNDLKKRLAEDCDLFIGMGNSLLTAASVGVPCLITGYSINGKMSANIYTPFYENQFYSLGENIDEKTTFNPKYNLMQMLDTFCKDPKSWLKKQNKALKKFDASRSAEILMSNALKSKLKYNDFKKVGLLEPDGYSFLLYKIKMKLSENFRKIEDERFIKTS